LEVISTAGSAEKLKKCEELGADYLINYKLEDFEDKVTEYTQGEGVDIIADPIGASYWQKNTNSIALDGRWVFYGTMGGGEIQKANIRPLLHKRVSFLATTLKSRSDPYKKDLLEKMTSVVFPALKENKFEILISKTFPLEQIAEAHAFMEANANIGKIILDLNHI